MIKRVVGVELDDGTRIEFVDGEMTEEDRRKIEELLKEIEEKEEKKNAETN